MKTLLTVALLLLVAGAAQAQDTFCYSWEDNGDVLSCYLCENMTFYNDDTVASDGVRSLALAESDGTSTPQAYVAWITGLTEGDEVTVSFDVYDDTVGANPSIRIWGHYTLDGDIDAYDGSAGGNSTYSGAVGGWENLAYTWTVAAGKTNLCVEARPYDTAPYGPTFCWVDNVCVTAPAGAYIYFPGGTIPAEDNTWSGVKALFR
jgi:hypothetical protein